MTSASPALAEPSRAAPGAWRAQGFVEFLLVGGAALFLFPLAFVAERVFGLDAAELAVGFLTFHAAHVLNDPHFSVTYFLFYEDVRGRAFGSALGPRDRVRYWIAGFVVPLGLAAWAVGAIQSGSARTLGLMIQLMFLLVGWHYVKQGFGVLSVLSARRGVVYSPTERRVLLFHCFAAWAYAWANPFDPGKEVEEKGVVYTTLGEPRWLEPLCLSIFALSAIALGLVLIRRWRRERRLPPLAPLSAFLITVWLLTVYTSLDPLMVYVIPALHSVQYLYFVWLLKKNEARAEEGPPRFGRPVALRVGILAVSALALGFVLFHGAPALLDQSLVLGGSDGPLGPTPFFAALFAFVNIHHYFMDNVIWRRQNPKMKYLRA